MPRLLTACITAFVTFASRTLAGDVAILDGEPITREQIVRELTNGGSSTQERADDLFAHPRTRKQLLEHAVSTRLLSKAGQQKGLEKSRAFEEQMAEARTRILSQLYLQQYLEENMSERQQLAYFTKNQSRYSNKEVRAAHIILNDEALAQTVLKEALRSGADFEMLARQYSSGASARRGGDLGFFGRGHMEPSFEDAAFATPKGEVHPAIVRTGYGYHVIRVLDVRGSDAVKFDDVREAVRDDMARELRDQLITTLKGQAKLQILDEALKQP